MRALTRAALVPIRSGDGSGRAAPVLEKKVPGDLKLDICGLGNNKGCKTFLDHLNKACSVRGSNTRMGVSSFHL